MLIVCDFDGTVTEQDITDLVWDDHLDDRSRAEIARGYDAGRLSMLEVMDGGWRRVRRSPAELLAELRDRVRVREGFERLVCFAGSRSHELRVLSHGLEFYIKAYLPPGIAYDCLVGTFGTSWRVSLPSGTELAHGEDFKAHVVTRLRTGRGEEPIAFIGNGLNDFAAATMCDRIFAVGSSGLARLCQREGVAFTEFTTFGQVVAALEAG